MVLWPQKCNKYSKLVILSMTHLTSSGDFDCIIINDVDLTLLVVQRKISPKFGDKNFIYTESVQNINIVIWRLNNE